MNKRRLGTPSARDIWRFKKFINFKGPLKPQCSSRCHLFKGTPSEPYAKFWYQGRTIWATHFAYSFLGATPTTINEDKPFILHLCDVPRCVNPEHLRAGTAKENSDDRSNRKRCNSPKGDKCSWTKISNYRIRKIKSRLEADDKLTQQEIADELEMCQSSICRRLKGL